MFSSLLSSSSPKSFLFYFFLKSSSLFIIIVKEEIPKGFFRPKSTFALTGAAVPPLNQWSCPSSPPHPHTQFSSSYLILILSSSSSILLSSSSSPHHPHTQFSSSYSSLLIIFNSPPPQFKLPQRCLKYKERISSFQSEIQLLFEIAQHKCFRWSESLGRSTTILCFLTMIMLKMANDDVDNDEGCEWWRWWYWRWQLVGI